jgi:tetratricopeptide (TPR) repeat protein
VSLSVALLASVIALYAQWRVNQTLRVTTSNVVRENVFMDSAAAGMRNETLRMLQEMEINLPRIMHGATFKTRTTLGSAFTYAEQFDSAVSCYEKAKEINPDDPEPYLALAAIRKIQGRHEESARNLETVLEQQPGNAKAWNYLGWIYFILGRDEKARQAYERALRIRPDYADALFNLALIEQQQGNSKSYAALLERSRALLLRKTSDYPEYAEAHFHLAKVLAHENEPEQALNHLKIAITIDGDFAFWARHEPFFKEIIKAHPEGEKAITAVADIYVANKVTQILTAAGLH